MELSAELPSPQDSRFVRTRLLADVLDAALPPDHPLATAPELRLSDLAGQPWIYGTEGPWHDITTADPRPTTHVRLDVLPDGGIARLRLHGTLTPPAAD